MSDHKIAGPSLTEGIEVKESAHAKPSHTRVELAPVATPRVAIDANWSKGKRRAVAVGVSLAAVAALGAGVWMYLRSLPPAMPTTAEEAIAVMNSAAYKRLDGQRQQQYAAEAARLLIAVPEDQRAALRENPDARRAMREAMEKRMEDLAKRIARGETLEMPRMPFGPGGPGGPGAPAGGSPGGPAGPGRGPGGPGRGGPMTNEMRERITGMIEGRIMTGNAQMTGLIGEMRERMRQQAGGPPGGGR